jgi:hypothetical protein
MNTPAMALLSERTGGRYYTKDLSYIYFPYTGGHIGLLTGGSFAFTEGFGIRFGGLLAFIFVY